MRLALEQMEAEKDMENFVRDYGTGNVIPDPPPFINYATGEAPPSRPPRQAQFSRSSQRPPPQRPPPVEEEPTMNTAGVGAGGSKRRDHQPDGRTAAQTPGSSRDPQVNGSSVNAASTSTSRPTAKNIRDQNAEPIDPTAETFIKVGSNTYKVDPSNDPQQGSSRSGAPSAVQSGPKGVDPLAEQMENLKNAASGSGGVRKSGTWKQSDQRPGQSSSRKGTAESTAGPSSLSLPQPNANASGSQGQAPRDYRNSAEIVVGVHPSASRPSSPNPPTASFMRPPQGSSLDVEAVVADYQQSLPGEHKTVSRSNSRQRSHSDAHTPITHGHNPSRSQSMATTAPRDGHTGIGAYGRSSPHPISRSASPAAGNRNNLVSQPPSNAAMTGYGQPPRNVSPNRAGIVLDQNGAVIADKMAEQYKQQQGVPQHSYNNQGSQIRTSYMASSNGVVAPPSQPQGYVMQPPTGYQPPPQNQSYVVYNPPPIQYPQSQPIYHPQSGSYVPPNPTHMHHPQGYGYRPPSPVVERTPSPMPPPPGAPPTGQTTEEGVGILFYGKSPFKFSNRAWCLLVVCLVKALYDYTATIEEEFDFQAGDIIAVTATPEDGWWSGELLDEARRQRGRHVFPSNFVTLF